MNIQDTQVILGSFLVLLPLASMVAEAMGLRKNGSLPLFQYFLLMVTLFLFLGLALPFLWSHCGPGAQDEYFRKLNNYGLCQFALERRDADRSLPGDCCPEGGEYVYSVEHGRSLCTYPPHRALLLGETTPPVIFRRPW